MKTKRARVAKPLVFILFGILFGVMTNVIFDEIVSAMWTPLAVALYFLVFTLLLCGLIMFVSREIRHTANRRLLFRDMVILVITLFLTSMLFEFLYEIGMNSKRNEADSYVLMIDDSGSMEGNDPEGQRVVAINNLLKDKSAAFPYAAYTFADTVKQVRTMQPKSAQQSGWNLQSSGGTAMFACLETALSDIASGKLQITPATRVLLLSDGYAGDTPIFKSKILKEYIKKNIIISTIGVGANVDDRTLGHVAEYTGGVYVHIDDISMLDTAMINAAAQTSSRNLLGFRGFCSTNTLHAILRVLFLLLIVAQIYMLKIYAYGKYYKPQLIISGLGCIIAAFLPEITLELFSWNVDIMRVLFCILISLTLVEKVEPICHRERRLDEEEDETYVIDLEGIDSLSKDGEIDSAQTYTLG